MKVLVKRFRHLRSIYPTDLQVYLSMKTSPHQFQYHLKSYVNWKLKKMRDKYPISDDLDKEIFKTSVLEYEGIKNHVEKIPPSKYQDKRHPLWFYVNKINEYDN